MEAHLRIVIASEAGARLDEVTNMVAGLGHEVIARESSFTDIDQITSRVHPDVAIVIVAEATDEALKTIDRIVYEAACPVIAILDVEDRSFIKEAAKRGIFAYIADGHEEAELQSSIDIVLRRFAEYHDLEGAFGRRAITERAKGILMERHNIDEREAFEMLRVEARRSNRKMVEVAEVVVSARRLLRSPTGAPESPTT